MVMFLDLFAAILLIRKASLLQEVVSAILPAAHQQRRHDKLVERHPVHPQPLAP